MFITEGNCTGYGIDEEGRTCVQYCLSYQGTAIGHYNSPDFCVESPSLAHQEDKQAETAINRQEAAMSHKHFSFKRVSDCQNADAQGVCGLSDTGRECSRLTDDYDDYEC